MVQQDQTVQDPIRSTMQCDVGILQHGTAAARTFV